MHLEYTCGYVSEFLERNHTGSTDKKTKYEVKRYQENQENAYSAMKTSKVLGP